MMNSEKCPNEYIFENLGWQETSWGKLTEHNLPTPSCSEENTDKDAEKDAEFNNITSFESTIE